MIRPSARFLGAAALIALFVPVFQAVAQHMFRLLLHRLLRRQPPSSRLPPRQRLPRPAPGPTAAPVFPKPNPANFTATSPTKEVVDAFLQANWGYDENRMWQVQAILKTPWTESAK